MREFNTTEYQFSHGKKPRGLGHWAFVPSDYVWPQGEMPSDAIAWEYGTFSEAKKEVAKKWSRVQYWTVLP